MTDQAEQRVDDEVGRMLRAFEGPADPRPRQRRRRGKERVRRALLGVTAAAVAVSAVGVSALLLDGKGEGRPAAVSGTQSCTELRAGGRRYVARRVPASAFAVGVPLRGRAVLVCGGTRVPDADVARVVGLGPALALVRPGERGLVYVAVGRCHDAAAETELVACLHKERSAP